MPPTPCCHGAGPRSHIQYVVNRSQCEGKCIVTTNCTSLPFGRRGPPREDRGDHLISERCCAKRLVCAVWKSERIRPRKPASSQLGDREAPRRTPCAPPASANQTFLIGSRTTPEKYQGLGRAERLAQRGGPRGTRGSSAISMRASERLGNPCPERSNRATRLDADSRRRSRCIRPCWRADQNDAGAS